MPESSIIGVSEQTDELLVEFTKQFRGIHSDYWIALRTAVVLVIYFFECKKCGLCCRYSPPSFKEKEAKAIADFLGKTVDDLPLERYYNVIGDEIRIYYKAPKPCPFLGKDGKCTVYPVRGAQCRSFPFEWLMYSMVPQYCLGTKEAIKKALVYMKENIEKLRRAAVVLEPYLRQYAKSSAYKEEMREKEFEPLVKELVEVLGLKYKKIVIEFEF